MDKKSKKGKKWKSGKYGNQLLPLAATRESKGRMLTDSLICREEEQKGKEAQGPHGKKVI